MRLSRDSLARELGNIIRYQRAAVQLSGRGWNASVFITKPNNSYKIVGAVIYS